MLDILAKKFSLFANLCKCFVLFTFSFEGQILSYKLFHSTKSFWSIKNAKFVPISDLVIRFKNPHKIVYAENSVYFKFPRFCTFSKGFLLAENYASILFSPSTKLSNSAESTDLV
jgi:hypothetical protein